MAVSHAQSSRKKLGHWQKRSEQLRSAKTRAALVTAARRLFGEHGYHETGTNEVVALAKITRGALYHHFRDKQHLFEAVYRQVSTELSLSYFDGSTGWYCQAATTGVAVAGAFLGDRAIEPMFCSGALATCAGQAAPSGKAERVGDGYRISGSFSFGSGIPNASWVVGGYMLHQDGEPVLKSDGAPVMLIAFAPRSGVELLGNWDVLGLRGTGSYDFRVVEQVIHADFAFDAAQPEQKRGGALYGMGFSAIPAMCHAAFGLGCSSRLLDEWMRHARSKSRLHGRKLAESEAFQKSFATAHARTRSAEAYVKATFAQLFGSAERGSISDDLKLDGRLCASNIISDGAEIGQTAFASSATTGLRNGNRIQRCYRDLQAANAHFLTGEQSFIDAGRFLAGVPGSSPGL